MMCHLVLTEPFLAFIEHTSKDALKRLKVGLKQVTGKLYSKPHGIVPVACSQAVLNTSSDTLIITLQSRVEGIDRLTSNLQQAQTQLVAAEQREAVANQHAAAHLQVSSSALALSIFASTCHFANGHCTLCHW